MAETDRVLSIQSHVVRGYVGNRSAVFPLQVLGFEVDFVNSVQLCNHTWYKHIAGQVLESDDLRVLIDGLKANDLIDYSYLLTGYIGSKSFQEEVLKVVQELKDLCPGLKYVCDPVMGDNGQMYVPEELAPTYREKFVAIADIITPNQFELEILSGMAIKTEQDALQAMKLLQEKGAKNVVLSSGELGREKDIMVTMGRSESGDVFRIEFPRLEANFVGSGDVFAALLLAWSEKHPDNLQLACEKTISSLQAILKRTLSSAEAQAKGGTPNIGQLELRLVQSKADIENPPTGIVKAGPVYDS
ncbi:pyridoxal kinase-like [Corticium candelabrum]|uniref:pyridoxal kinase-like n=1 Tax=Corticium candelabrum TaxID=121492 RepID=UPI002E2722D6|nr:pyridoxal kinase-like [Corticium candelabrum]